MTLAVEPASLWPLAASRSSPRAARREGAETPVDSRTVIIEGVKLHYLTSGDGPAVILLHGYTQTSRMWRPVIPLAAIHQVLTLQTTNSGMKEKFNG
jgi:hypothetical protein